MQIPEYVQFCIRRLEGHGFEAYAVGGCVRDSLLGRIPQDFDLCTNALPEQTEVIFSDHRLVLAGKKHGTVAVVTDAGIVEITTYRTEGDYCDNRHPEWVEFVPDIREDLSRRDFTINAMAYSPTRGFVDPFGGRSDLQSRILRAVGDPDQRFKEDSLRILRGTRFAAKYRLRVDAPTLDAMLRQRHLMGNLAKERIFEELCKLITHASGEDLLRFAPILTAVIPELAPMIGFDQRNPHHAYDLFRHTVFVTDAVPGKLALKWAALLHDTGKIATFTLDEAGHGHFYGHAKESAAIARQILLRLKAPTALREQVEQLIELHMLWLEPEKKVVRRWLSKLGREMMEDLLILQKADTGSKGTGIDGDLSHLAKIRTLIGAILEEDACLSLKDLAINGHDLMSLGFSGKDIGNCLNYLLEQVMEENIPNEKSALILGAAQYKTTLGGNGS